MCKEQDRNFDDISHKFTKNIYGTTKGKIREVIIWQDIETILQHFPTEQKLTILDAGGGQGQIACKLAKLGHDVTVCDISTQMLAIAQLHAQTEEVDLNYLNKAVQDLPTDFAQTYDIVLCHAVLEWVNDGREVIYALKQLLKPAGFLSLMFYNLHGLLFRTVTLGNFGYVQTGLKKRKKKTLSPDYPRNPDDVYQWLAEYDLNILQKTGIRVFHDYMLDKLKQQNCFNDLLELEMQYCRQQPYLQLARYIHVIAQ